MVQVGPKRLVEEPKAKVPGGNRGRKPGFEGGQVRLIMHLPKKKGFRSVIRKEYNVVNIEKLNQLAPGTVVTLELLVERGWLPATQKPIKILGNGELKIALSFKKDQFTFSKSALEKITKAGGTVGT